MIIPESLVSKLRYPLLLPKDLLENCIWRKTKGFCHLVVSHMLMSAFERSPLLNVWDVPKSFSSRTMPVHVPLGPNGAPPAPSQSTPKSTWDILKTIPWIFLYWQVKMDFYHVPFSNKIIKYSILILNITLRLVILTSELWIDTLHYGSKSQSKKASCKWRAAKGRPSVLGHRSWWKSTLKQLRVKIMFVNNVCHFCLWVWFRIYWEFVV